jgi:hypothetical protein
LEPTPTTLQMHEACKNAKYQKNTNNNTSFAKKQDPLLDLPLLHGLKLFKHNSGDNVIIQILPIDFG